MNALSSRVLALLSFVIVVAAAMPAAAFPGFYMGKGTQKRQLSEAQIVVMRKGEMTAVTVMADYDGPLEPFAIVLAVPPDVTLERVKTLKREFVDRVDALTAPRYHEFWEQDPCEPGPPEQEWERKLMASSDTDFLGQPITDDVKKKKVDKELFVRTDPEFKEGEYTKFTLLEGPLADYARGQGYTVPPGAEQALQPLLAEGYKVLVAEVDDKRVELVGGGRGQLSPIRYWSDHPVTKLPVRLGLLNSPGKQELIIYVLDPTARYEVKNYENVFPPTNIESELELDRGGHTFYVKEHTGELYAAIHDLLLAQKPQGFLNEYAWHSAGCGEPCATEPLFVHELMSLGGDAFETLVSDEEKNPEVPELTKEEKKALKDEWDEAKLTPKERKDREKQLEEERKKVAHNKALIERHKYMVTRLHHRYDAANLPKDVVIGPAAGHVKGGVDIPKGEKGELPTGVSPAPASKFQTRFVNLHPWKGMQKCDKPERWKWGKAPRTYRGLRKIWIADDLGRRDRKQVKPAEVVRTAIPALGLTGVPVEPSDAGADGGLGAGGGKRCGCSLVQAGSSQGLVAAFALVSLLGFRRRGGVRK